MSSNVDWATSGPTMYSNTEQRIGTWRNGKPLYRRVVTVALGGASSMGVAHGIPIDVPVAIHANRGLTTAGNTYTNSAGNTFAIRLSATQVLM